MRSTAVSEVVPDVPPVGDLCRVGCTVMGRRRYGLVQLSAGADGEPLAVNPNVVEPDAGIDSL